MKLTIGARYCIDGLSDRGTGLTDYKRWQYHGTVNGAHLFSGSTSDPRFIDPACLARVGPNRLIYSQQGKRQ